MPETLKTSCSNVQGYYISWSQMRKLKVKMLRSDSQGKVERRYIGKSTQNKKHFNILIPIFGNTGRKAFFGLFIFWSIAKHLSVIYAAVIRSKFTKLQKMQAP